MRSQLQDAELEISITFELTSIFDHTIYAAFSKVVQKLFPFVDHIKNLLDHLISCCKIEKAFVFDLLSKIFIASDSGPIDISHYEICSELIDVLIDVSCIFSESPKFDENCTTIKLRTGDDEQGNTYLYLREVDESLALVCLIQEVEFEKRHLINYNIDQIKLGLKELFKTAGTSK